MKVIQIVCRVPGFRRAGFAHPALATYAIGAFSAAELEQLASEPALEVSVVEGEPTHWTEASAAWLSPLRPSSTAEVPTDVLLAEGPAQPLSASQVAPPSDNLAEEAGDPASVAVGGDIDPAQGGSNPQPDASLDTGTGAPDVLDESRGEAPARDAAPAGAAQVKGSRRATAGKAGA